MIQRKSLFVLCMALLLFVPLQAKNGSSGKSTFKWALGAVGVLSIGSFFYYWAKKMQSHQKKVLCALAQELVKALRDGNWKKVSDLYQFFDSLPLLVRNPDDVCHFDERLRKDFFNNQKVVNTIESNFFQSLQDATDQENLNNLAFSYQSILTAMNSLIEMEDAVRNKNQNAITKSNIDNFIRFPFKLLENCWNSLSQEFNTALDNAMQKEKQSLWDRVVTIRKRLLFIEAQANRTYTTLIPHFAALQKSVGNKEAETIIASLYIKMEQFVVDLSLKLLTNPHVNYFEYCSLGEFDKTIQPIRSIIAEDNKIKWLTHDSIKVHFSTIQNQYKKELEIINQTITALVVKGLSTEEITAIEQTKVELSEINPRTLYEWLQPVGLQQWNQKLDLIIQQIATAQGAVKIAETKKPQQQKPGQKIKTIRIPTPSPQKQKSSRTPTKQKQPDLIEEQKVLFYEAQAEAIELILNNDLPYSLIVMSGETVDQQTVTLMNTYNQKMKNLFEYLTTTQFSEKNANKLVEDMQSMLGEASVLNRAQKDLLKKKNIKITLFTSDQKANLTTLATQTKVSKARAQAKKPEPVKLTEEEKQKLEKLQKEREEKTVARQEEKRLEKEFKTMRKHMLDKIFTVDNKMPRKFKLKSGKQEPMESDGASDAVLKYNVRMKNFLEKKFDPKIAQDSVTELQEIQAALNEIFDQGIIKTITDSERYDSIPFTEDEEDGSYLEVIDWE